MNFEMMLNEINLLKDHNDDKVEYSNICKILKEMVLLPSKITDKKEVLIYIVLQLINIYENKPGDTLQNDIEYGQQTMQELDAQSGEDEAQKIINNIIAEMYSIMLFAKKNQRLILKYLYMLYTNIPLTPLTDDLDQWEVIGSYDGFNIYKSKRCDKVFMDERTGKVTFTEGKIFITEDNKYIINEDSAVELRLPSMLPETKYIKL